MNILLLWPFIHPNLYPVLVSFKEYGFNVTLVIENEPKTIYEIPSKKIYVTASSIDNDSQFIKDIKPDFVLVRKKSPKFINILKISKAFGAQTYLFDLRACNTRSPRKYISRILKNLSDYYKTGEFKMMSPVRGNGVRMPFSYYLPFPTNCNKYNINRTYLPGGIPQIMVCGKLFHPRKRMDWVLNAIQHLNIKCKIVIVGASLKDDSMYTLEQKLCYDNIIKLVSKSYKNIEVILIENCNHERMFDLYNSSDVFVLPASGEPLGISPLEAMSCGCSVLVSDESGIASYVTEGKTGFLFKENSYEDFKSKLKILLDTTQIIQRGRSARQSVVSNYSSSAFIQSFQEIIKK